jgi:hypothetical protein
MPMAASGRGSSRRRLPMLCSRSPFGGSLSALCQPSSGANAGSMHEALTLDRLGCHSAE